MPRPDGTVSDPTPNKPKPPITGGKQPGTNPFQGGKGSPVPAGSPLSSEDWNAMTPAEQWIHVDNLKRFYQQQTAAAAPAGGGGGGPATAGVGEGIEAAAANPAFSEEDARNRFPQLAWMLDEPELKGIFVLAVTANWGLPQLQGALYKTQWWQQKSATVRQWTQLLHQDPASARQRIVNEGTKIENMARQWGLGLSKNELFATTVNYIQYGWDEANLRKELGRTMRAIVKDPKRQLTGQARALVDGYKALGSQYLLPVSDKTAAKYAIQEFEGGGTQEGVQASFVKQAKARFSWLSDELDRGVTVAEYFEPVRQSVAQLLEVPDEEVNLMDSKWNKMVEYVDPQNGKPRGMTITEAQNYARRQDEWQHTDNAREQGFALANRIAESFGVVKR